MGDERLLAEVRGACKVAVGSERWAVSGGAVCSEQWAVGSGQCAVSSGQWAVAQLGGD